VFEWKIGLDKVLEILNLIPLNSKVLFVIHPDYFEYEAFEEKEIQTIQLFKQSIFRKYIPKIVKKTYRSILNKKHHRFLIIIIKKYVNRLKNLLEV